MPRHQRPAPKSTSTGTIRLISGQWRGRKLPVLNAEGLRPTTDRVKETLFNWLAADIRDSRCLDVFSGSGSLGFEALSRYAQYVMMIEKEPVSARQLQKNLETLSCQAADVMCQDALSVLAQPCRHPFDIVFLDPPFRKDLLPAAIGLLEAQGWLSDQALIYIECEREITSLTVPETWHLSKEKAAGQVCYQLYERAPEL
jgi:16S rRNA (guanine966-N2)-methyltransferase